MDSHDGICCADCTLELPRLPKNHCPICALPTLAGEICGHCLREPPHFDSTSAAFAYAFPLDKLVQAMKFDQRIELVNYLADELAKKIYRRPDYIIAMPLHSTRLRERGYNQSHLLAQRLSKQLNVPILKNVCQRVRATTPQTTLPSKDRKQNVHQAFACHAALNDKEIAIVDDVMTSGASIDELARALKNTGARTVNAWIIARTLPDHQSSQRELS